MTPPAPCSQTPAPDTSRPHPLSAAWAVGLCCILAAGCEKPGAAPAAKADIPVIPVSYPVTREVTDVEEFTGRTDAVNYVNVVARVTGYLDKIPFKEGAEVKKGDLLFEIDARPYKAQLEQAQSQVALNEASLNLARTTFNRDRAIAASSAGAMSQQALDQDRAAVNEAEARLKASQASMKVYELNLQFTEVKSPIDGQISRYYLTLGNLVNQDQTLLTTIVSLDPMYAYFDMDEPTFVRIQRGIDEGRIKDPRMGLGLPVYLGLQGEDGFPHRGAINFLNNQVTSSTGSLLVRGVFSNVGDKANAAATVAAQPQVLPLLGCSGYFLTPPKTRLLPGMFARIRLPIGEPHKAVLVLDRALGSDQGLKFLYVLDKDDKIEYRRVRTGSLQDDGLRVIEDGLKPDDRVVIGALQRVRPMQKVSPDLRPMPTIGPADAAGPADPAAPAKGTPGPGKPSPTPKSPKTPGGE